MCATIAGTGPLAGCGDSVPRTASHGSGPPETADPPAPLPAGWRRVVNATAGFTVGLPPGWQARGHHDATLVRSSDGALALAISADRSDDGQNDPPTTYLRREVGHLPGYRDLRVGATAPLRAGRYPGATISASGTATGTGVRQAIMLVALRRPGRVTYSIGVFRSSRTAAARYRALVDQIVRSFRARPPQY